MACAAPGDSLYCGDSESPAQDFPNADAQLSDSDAGSDPPKSVPASDDEYDPGAFPRSFVAAYCPVEGCGVDAPFLDGLDLVAHVSEAHGIFIREPAAVVPIIDRYLREALPELRAAPLRDAPEYPAWEARDDALRQRLQDARLAEVLALQAAERAGAHRVGRTCLFCPTACADKRALFAHMFRAHGCNLGRLDNLVMVDDFLALLEHTLVRLRTCIYCGGRFPGGAVLRKHMRNKGHHRIHPRNHAYDRFYVVNYMRPGRLYSSGSDDECVGRDAADNNDVAADWADLTEPVDARATCLLCPAMLPDADACVAHMAGAHGFDVDALRARHGLDDYDAIRLVNYMRACALDAACPFCPQPAVSEAVPRESSAESESECSWPAESRDGAASAVEAAAAELSQLSVTSTGDTAAGLAGCLDAEGDAVHSACRDGQDTDAPECDVAEHVRNAHGAVLDLPPAAHWRGAVRWLFPVFEDDPLLCRLAADASP